MTIAHILCCRLEDRPITRQKVKILKIFKTRKSVGGPVAWVQKANQDLESEKTGRDSYRSLRKESMEKKNEDQHRTLFITQGAFT